MSYAPELTAFDFPGFLRRAAGSVVGALQQNLLTKRSIRSERQCLVMVVIGAWSVPGASSAPRTSRVSPGSLELSSTIDRAPVLRRRDRLVIILMFLPAASHR